MLFAYEEINFEEYSGEKAEKQKDEDIWGGHTTEKFSTPGKELVLDISSMPRDQRESFGKSVELYYDAIFLSEGCYCSSRETCRWKPTLTCRTLLGRKVTNTKPDFLGLCCIETWELPNYEIGERYYRIPEKRGSDTSY